MTQAHITKDYDWADFYKALDSKPPRKTLIEALDRIGETKGLAVDLGCGNGNDTMELLSRGWCVLAIDASAESIKRVVDRTPVDLKDNLVTAQKAFEELTYLPPCEFVYAGFALPFCKPSDYNRLWDMIVGAIKPTGWFAGQFFGIRDEWSNNSDMTFHTVEQVRDLLSAFHVRWLLEVDEDATTATGTPKHWHAFSVVARKKNA